MIYTVQPGDTLSGIAARLLGTAQAATTLFAINKARIKSGSPSKLSAGETLVIPEQMIEGAKGKRKSRDPNEVALEVNGIEYVGCTAVRISRSMETASAAFEAEVFDRWKESSEAWPIFAGDEVRVWIGPDLMVEGHVDSVDLSVDADSRGMRVSGRDRTADLVDCSAMNRPGVWKNKKLEEIARAIAAPFGIKVVCDVDTGPAIALFSLQPGERCLEALSRAAIAKNLITTSGRSGSLAITRSGIRRTADAIVEGQNLKTGSSQTSSTDRFSDYIVEGQGDGQGKNAHKGTYRDPSVNRYRPLMIHADQKATAEYVKGRAEWEARSRAAKSRSASVVVVGWRQSSGALWETNRIVPVESNSLGLSEDLLIAEVSYELSDGGTTAGLRLVRPDAYTSAEHLDATKDMVRGRHKKAKKQAATQVEIDEENDLPSGEGEDF